MKLVPQWWKTHFLMAEFGLALLLAAGFYVWVERYNGSGIVNSTLTGNRSAVYGTLASITGSLLGFVLATVSIVFGFATHERLAVVRESPHYMTLWKVFTSSIRWLGVATVFLLTGLLLDRDTSPTRLVMHLCVLVFLLAIFRLARCVWVLEKVIGLVTSPSKARSGNEP